MLPLKICSRAEAHARAWCKVCTAVDGARATLFRLISASPSCLLDFFRVSSVAQGDGRDITIVHPPARPVRNRREPSRADDCSPKRLAWHEHRVQVGRLLVADPRWLWMARW